MRLWLDRLRLDLVKNYDKSKLALKYKINMSNGEKLYCLHDIDYELTCDDLFYPVLISKGFTHGIYRVAGDQLIMIYKGQEIVSISDEQKLSFVNVDNLEFQDLTEDISVKEEAISLLGKIQKDDGNSFYWYGVGAVSILIILITLFFGFIN